MIGVVGHRGRLGSELIERGGIPVECDITNRVSVAAALADAPPLRILINCAAYTKVDGAEQETKLAYGVNLHGVGILRQEFDGYFVHISTGFVFDGKAGPYSDVNPPAPNPLNEYSASKVGGEYAALMRQPTLVVRTLDLFGPGPKTDFVKQVLVLLATGEPFTMPATLYGNPTYTPFMADILMDLIENEAPTGIINLAGTTILTRYKFAQMIATTFGHNPDLVQPTDEIKGVPRPLRGTLLMTRLQEMGYTVADLFTAQEGLDNLKAYG